MRWLLIPAFLTMALACGDASNAAAAADDDDDDASPPEADASIPATDASPGDAAAPLSPFASALDAYFTEQTEARHFSGSVLAIDDGQIVLEKGYAEADRESHRLNAPDTIFRIGSLSKQFTATAILALAADGKLAVGDPVGKYLTEYPSENLEQDGTVVTLHHLLSQTSGLPDGNDTDYFKDHAWFSVMDPTEVMKAAMTLPLVQKPGAAFEYLNYNYLLLGLVIERVAGVPYEQFLRERFFAPLGMADTGTHLPAAAADRAAIGYYKSGSKLATMAHDAEFVDHDVQLAFGAGQVYSTVRDLARWDRALAAGTLLPAELQALLFTPNLQSYGYGWVMQDVLGTAVQWHNGALSPLGFTCLVTRVPSKQRFVVYLANYDLGIVQPLEPDVMKLAVE